MLPLHFSCQERAEFTVPDTRSLTLPGVPQEQRMDPGPKQKIGGPGLSGGKAPKTQISVYYLIPFWELLSYIIFPQNYLSLFFLLKLFSFEIIYTPYMLLSHLIHLHFYYK